MQKEKPMTNREVCRKLLPACGLLTLALLAGCKLTPAKNATATPDGKSVSSPSAAADDLQAAMDKLDKSIHSPTAPFHVAFKKSDSNGFVYQCEADVSPSGITGQRTDSSPTTHIGNDVFPATTSVRPLNGKPYGSQEWNIVYGGIIMAFLNGHIRDAQEGVKYAGDEQTGGYDARRYNFDLTGVDADIKKVMIVANALGARQTKDYNVKGSAWIAKEDGRMVKFQFENIYTFGDNTTRSTRYEGAVTRK
jgi:hypothetical protein